MKSARAFRHLAAIAAVCVASWFVAANSRFVSSAAPPEAPSTAAPAFDLKAFAAESRVSELDVPAIGDAKKESNFSGIAYNPATRTLLVVDNQPNAEDTADKPDQGDLYEFDLEGKHLRHIDLVGFSDPEAIAYMGADPVRPEHDLYVVAEERIGTLAIVSVARGKDEVRLTRGETGPVIEPKPNPIDDRNDQPNDGLEGVAYDAKADAFYVVKEGGSTRGVYRVQRDGRCEPLTIAGLFEGVKDRSEPLEDLADVQFHGGQLLVLSEISNRVVAVGIKDLEGDLEGEIVGQFPPLGETLPHKQPEGIAVADDGQTLWILGEPREFARYIKENTAPKMPK